VLAASCARQGSYTINGNINGLKGEVILYTLNDAGVPAPSDTVSTENGEFTFKGSVATPYMARLTLNGARAPEFFLENTAITITGQVDSLGKLTFSGSKLQDIVNGVNEKVNALNPQMKELFDAFQKAQAANDEGALAVLEARQDSLEHVQMDIQKQAVAANSSNAAGPYFAYKRLRYYLELDEMKAMAAAFQGDALKDIYATQLNDYIKVQETVAVGQIAPEFEMENPDGKIIKLSDYRGKYLMIDFWASWCGPCRRENPNVAKLYNSVKGRDFDILGVSLDTDRESWLKAIKDDGLVWHHVSDLKGWDNRVAKLYGVSSIPHTVLLDKEGKIIGKNLRGEQLSEKIKELVD
jgi:peroxiredoxin